MTARHRRSGLSDRVAFFEALRPAREACIGQLKNLRPFGADYHQMSVIIAAIDSAAEYFTKQRSFYLSANPDQIGASLSRDARAK